MRRTVASVVVVGVAWATVSFAQAPDEEEVTRAQFDTWMAELSPRVARQPFEP